MTKTLEAKFTKLKIGNLYKRSEIEDLLRIDHVFPTGVREFKNCVFLYVTLDKTNKPVNHKYKDYFEDRIFYWESQKRQDPQSEVLQKIINEVLPPILFVRIKENDPFTYMGEIQFVSYDKETANPVQFSFLTQNFQELIINEENFININKILGTTLGKKSTNIKFKNITKKKSKSKSQGYENDPVIRKVIEDCAMNSAVNHYRKLGYIVEDVSLDRIGYDIRCVKNKTELRVEVKGTQSSGSEVNLTKNEVFNARNFNTTLFVLHNIRVNRENKKASGGEKKIIENWDPKDKDLVALTYKYKIK